MTLSPVTEQRVWVPGIFSRRGIFGQCASVITPRRSGALRHARERRCYLSPERGFVLTTRPWATFRELSWKCKLSS